MRTASASIVLVLWFALSVISAEPVTLEAKDAKISGYFEKRPSNGVEAFGIRGEGSTGQVHEGTMTFASFPGETGIYSVEFGVVLEPDGDPQYRISAGGKTLAEGRYPYIDGTRNCQSGAPTELAHLDLGEHTMNKGAEIVVWGKSVYYCGSAGNWHGAYTRWYELVFTPVGTPPGPDTTPVAKTKILRPTEGTTLAEGSVVTLQGEGENLAWKYDANSDGIGETAIAGGSTTTFKVPTGVNPPRTLTLKLSGSNGTDEKTFSIAEAKPVLTLLGPIGGETYQVGETMHIKWETDESRMADANVFLSPDNGRTWIMLNTTTVNVSNKSWGDFGWVIPREISFDGKTHTIDGNSQLLVKVEDYEPQSDEYRAVSPAPFSVEKALSTLSAPVGASRTVGHDDFAGYSVQGRRILSSAKQVQPGIILQVDRQGKLVGRTLAVGTSR